LQGDWSSDVCSSDLVPLAAFDVSPKRSQGATQLGFQIRQQLRLLQMRFGVSRFFKDLLLIGNGRDQSCARRFLVAVVSRDRRERSEERRVGKESRPW